VEPWKSWKAVTQVDLGFLEEVVLPDEVSLADERYGFGVHLSRETFAPRNYQRTVRSPRVCKYLRSVGK
jgi:hypothetical protein